MTHGRAWLWLPPIVWMGLIFFASSKSRLPCPEGFLGWDKLHHAAAYAVLSALVMRAVRRTFSCRLIVAAIVAIIVTASYGAIDELHQWYVPGRTFDLFDLVADSVGALVGAIVYAAVTSVQKCCKDQ